MIYVASPYSHPSATVREGRFRAACEATATLLREDRLAYSPIVHCHPLAGCGLPGDWAFWASHNEAMLERCTALHVLQLPGWQASRGIAEEVQIAGAHGIPVCYMPQQGEERLS